MNKILILISIILLSVSAIFIYFLLTPPSERGVNETLSENQTEVREIPKDETLVEVREISVLSNRFEPSQLTINFGETVKWINKDENITHQVICGTKHSQIFNVLLYPGTDFEYTIYNNITCWEPSVEGMKMNIIVK